MIDFTHSLTTEELLVQEDLLSIEEVSDLLGVARERVSQWIHDGTLVPVRSRGVYWFRPEDVRSLLEREGNGGSKGQILVIDDDPLVGRSVKTLLERAGYQTEVALIGLAALDAVSSQNFDLLVTDIRMPGMNGIETLQAIRVLRQELGRPPLPAIVITAYPEDEDRKQEAGRLGVEEFILKPFGIEELMSAIERSLPEEKRKGPHVS